MRLRQAKKVLRQWPIVRISTRRKAYQVAYKKLNESQQARLWATVKMMAKIKAARFLRLFAAPVSEPGSDE